MFRSNRGAAETRFWGPQTPLCSQVCPSLRFLHKDSLRTTLAKALGQADSASPRVMVVLA